MSKTWFITGATRGIGFEIVKAALARGDKVVATGRDLARTAQALAGLPAAQADRLLATALDVSVATQAQAAADAAMERFGRIDVLVNNAGYGQLGLFEELEAAEIERQFATNVFGLMHVTRAVLPVMRRQRAGHVFNLSSIGGVQGFNGASVYCASKFAVEGYSESLALEVAAFGIGVTIVEPGFFRTDFLDDRSVRYGSIQLEDYAPASAELQDTYSAYSHRQAGDPTKLAAALVRLAHKGQPPLHFAAGSDAVSGILSSLDARRAEIEQWRALSESTDFPPQAISTTA